MKHRSFYWVMGGLSGLLLALLLLRGVAEAACGNGNLIDKSNKPGTKALIIVQVQ